MSLATYPVPLVDTPPGLLSSVLDLLELSDRHGAECEELALVLAAFHSKARQITHARHNGIGQQSLEWDTHDCGSVVRRGGVAGWAISANWLEVPSA